MEISNLKMEANIQWKEINQEGRTENLPTIVCTLQYCCSKDEKITLKKIPERICFLYTWVHIHTYTQAYAPSSFLWDKPELALSSRDGHGPRYKDFPLAMRTGSGVSVTWIWMSTIWSWILSPSISTLLHLKSLASMDFTGELLYLLTSSQILLFPNRGERAEEGRRARGSHTFGMSLLQPSTRCCSSWQHFLLPDLQIINPSMWPQSASGPCGFPTFCLVILEWSLN